MEHHFENFDDFAVWVIFGGPDGGESKELNPLSFNKKLIPSVAVFQLQLRLLFLKYKEFVYQ
jgi:hypothetical protein